MSDELPATPAALPSGPTPDLNLRVLGHLVRYIVDHYGLRSLEQVATASGVPVASLQRATSWVAFEQFEGILSGARALMRDDDEFRNACAYRLAEVSGPVRLIIGALSPADAYELGARNMRLISTISAFKPERQKSGHVLIRYESSRAESRLMCLSRQAQIRELPTLWGLPPAVIVETTCISRGDAACAYKVHVYEHRRWLPMVAGGAVGGGVAFAAHLALAPTPIPHLSWVFPVIGAAIGYLSELRRSSRANRATTTAMNTAYLNLARDDARARRELFELHERQQRWTHLVEKQVAVRATVLERFVDMLGRMIINPRGPEMRDEAPIAKLRAQMTALRERVDEIDPATRGIIAKLNRAVEQLDAAMDDLVDIAADQSNLVSLMPQVLDVEPLAGELRSRLTALVHGREVRVSVFAVREAPPQVRADVLLFNRIIDNLLMNAARTTEHGSIVVEVGGRPGVLCIKISDTSRGLDESDIARIAEQEPPAGRALRTNQLVNLWTGARLLEQIGGKLEVMSLPGKGTTVRADFPLDFGGRSSNRPAARTSQPHAQLDADPKGSAGAL